MTKTSEQQDETSYTEVEGGVTAAQGFQAAGVYAGMKRKNKDLALLVSDVPATVAGTFTNNKVAAAPLLVTKEHMAKAATRAVVINSGTANACTGEAGLADARRTADIVARHLNVLPHHVLVASTGVIGQRLPMDKMEAGIERAFSQLSPDHWQEASEAIKTTDTYTKNYAVRFTLQGRTVHVGGMAKGSGMIHPNMATMLAFLTTDVAVEKQFLQDVLQSAVDETFNMITVDGDTSTNDMALLLANGQAGNTPLAAGDSEAQLFRNAVCQVCRALAQDIARDGEGATKFVSVQVQGAATSQDARAIARSVASSLLVKTAMFGEDANWGRILAAAGYAEAQVDPNKVDIYIGDVAVARNGAGAAFAEEKVQQLLAEQDIVITVNLQQGEYSATAWTCDLTYDYIKINAEYRT